MPTIGAQSPPLQGATADGDFDLTAQKGRPVVVYFYPRDATPGCTTEARDFRDLHGDFDALGAVIVGVSRDTVKSHDRFKTKECLPFPLVSDGDGAITEAWGVWREKKMYGRSSMGIVRSTFLVAPDGTVADIWDPVKVKGHASAVLDAVRKLVGA